ncbi:hypothetical protein RX717_04345 [Intestinibacillus sp. NTUH-41-i26]|uniref:hypothetical protein n=1 Tax=Intestinibacillus sp. NTUH-41-i26 TaxID=3079303 RepID=UPI002934BA83|nr:hypothetical protein [Intestinibacillus sp. NTUH-41-i26]WOC76224.1 hypothetical protein RX717_04345 [Intestinibacillus sp. NTUH-41-i26]
MMHPNDFPQMTPQFDQRVRAALESLPERPCRTRRFPWKRVVSIGCAAALCIGGTAFAAGVSGGFPLLFPQRHGRAPHGLCRRLRAGYADG